MNQTIIYSVAFYEVITSEGSLVVHISNAVAELTRLHADNLTADKEDERERSAVYERQNLTGLILQAARLANRPAEAQSLRAAVEGAPLGSPKVQSDYWRNRARLAALENRKADALTYYQLALQTRISPPTPWHGRIEDPVSDEARAVFKDLGGTDVAWVSGASRPGQNLKRPPKAVGRSLLGSFPPSNLPISRARRGSWPRSKARVS